MYTRVLPVAILCSAITYFYYSRQEKLTNEKKLYMDALQYNRYKRISFWIGFALSISLVYIFYIQKYSQISTPKQVDGFYMISSDRIGNSSDSDDIKNLSPSEKFRRSSIEDPSLLPLKSLAKPRPLGLGNKPEALEVIDKFVRDTECHQKKSFAIPTMVSLRNKCFDSIGKKESDEDFPLSYQRTSSREKMTEAIRKLPCEDATPYLAKIGKENSSNCPPSPHHGSYSSVQERALATIGYKSRPDSRVISFPR